MHRLTKLVIMVMISTEPEISIKSLVLSRLKDYLGHTFVIIRSLCPINRNYYSSIGLFLLITAFVLMHMWYNHMHSEIQQLAVVAVLIVIVLNHYLLRYMAI